MPVWCPLLSSCLATLDLVLERLDRPVDANEACLIIAGMMGLMGAVSITAFESSHFNDQVVESM